ETTDEKGEFFHWMAYDKFKNIEEIGKGAFSTVFRTKYLNQSGTYEEVAIKIQFLESDKINKNFTIIKEELKNIYTSKPFNTLEISERLSKLKLSKSAGIEVPNDI
ncbi:1381_t:CDS:2, partial [Dentiscutata heterogama]